MKTLNFKYPAMISLGLVLPFMMMELINQPSSAFPWALFLVLWLIAMIFILILKPVLHYRSGSHLQLVLSLGVLLFLAGVWISIVQDQLSCFYGIPNCD